MKIRNKLRGLPLNELIYIFSDILIKAIAFVSLPFFLNVMTTAEFGEFSLYQSIVSIGMVFIGLNISSAIVRFCVDSDQSKRYLATAVWIILAISFASLIVVLLIYFNLTVISFSLQLILTMFVYATFNCIFMVGLEIIRSNGKASRYGLFSLSFSVISTLLGLVLVYTMEDNLAFWRLLSIAITTLVMGGYLAIEIIRTDGPSFNRKTAKNLLTFSIPLIPFTLSTTILVHINKIFLQDIGLEAVGLYSFAANLATLIYVVSLALNRSLQVNIFTALRDKKDYVKKIQNNFYMFFIFYIMLIFGADILILIFGNKDYADAVTIIPILVLGYGFCYLFAVYSNFLYFYKRTKTLSMISIVGAVFICGSNFFLIPYMGYNGAALAMVFAYLIMFLLTHFYTINSLKIKPFKNVTVLLCIIILIIPVILKISLF